MAWSDVQEEYQTRKDIRANEEPKGPRQAIGIASRRGPGGSELTVPKRGQWTTLAHLLVTQEEPQGCLLGVTRRHRTFVVLLVFHKKTGVLTLISRPVEQLYAAFSLRYNSLFSTLPKSQVDKPSTHEPENASEQVRSADRAR